MTMPLWEDAPGPAVPRTITLIRLAGEMARAVGQLGVVAVEGEVHRPSISRGGWIFFVLRDRAAQIDVKVPRRHVARCRAVGGERVRVTGTVEWSADRGQVHLVATEVLPVGAGAIAALLEATRRSLRDAGLLDRAPRRWPLLPQRIGVVCGTDAAVRADIESVVAERFAGYPVVFEETTVSGPSAPGAIVGALAALVRRPGIDVVIVARGGGDPTSLLPWSSEEVCLAVAASAVPVVSAIGHEGDRPLCDEVADLRCGTPSMAAAAVVPARRHLQAAIDGLGERAERSFIARRDRSGRRLAVVDTSRSVAAGLDLARARVLRAGERMAAAHPDRSLAAARSRLDAAQWRRPTGEVLGRAAGRLDADARHLRALAPHRILERGYAVVRDADGRVVRRTGDLEVGDRVVVTVAAGSIAARVEEITHV